MSTLTEAWTTASAALPLGWILMGLTYQRSTVAIPTGQGRRYVEQEGLWLAWAEGDPGTRDRIEGQGRSPDQALLDLAKKLELLRGDPNG